MSTWRAVEIIDAVWAGGAEQLADVVGLCLAQTSKPFNVENSGFAANIADALVHGQSRQEGVDERRNSTQKVDSQEGDDELDMISRHDRNPIALLHVELARQPGRSEVYALVDLCISMRLAVGNDERTRAKVLSDQRQIVNGREVGQLKGHDGTGW